MQTVAKHVFKGEERRASVMADISIVSMGQQRLCCCSHQDGALTQQPLCLAHPLVCANCVEAQQNSLQSGVTAPNNLQDVPRTIWLVSIFTLVLCTVDTVKPVSLGILALCTKHTHLLLDIFSVVLAIIYRNIIFKNLPTFNKITDSLPQIMGFCGITVKPTI